MDKEVRVENLEIVLGTKYCQFSVVEQKLASIYRNQRRMYFLLIIIVKLLGMKVKLVDPTKLEKELNWDEKEETENEEY